MGLALISHGRGLNTSHAPNSMEKTPLKMMPFLGSTASSPTRLTWHIIQQTNYYRQQINTASLQELHRIFPRLLSIVFGYDGSSGWRLKYCNRVDHMNEFNAAYDFLSPMTGPLFQLIGKLDENNFRFEFPIKCLPYSSRVVLSSGEVPPFYYGKVQFTGDSQRAPDHIQLSAFEYFFFHFAYYLIYTQANGNSQSYFSWSPLKDCLYACLFDSYLHYFLPLNGLIPVPHGTKTKPSNLHAHTPTSPASFNAQSHTPLGLLKLTSQRVGGAYSGSGSAHCTTELGMHTEIFLATLIEFWLTQSSETPHSKGGRPSFVQSVGVSLEQVRFLRMLVKHVLLFSNGTETQQTTPTSILPSALTSVTEALRESVVTRFLRKPIYHFISNGLKHWPLNETFRYMLELWLTYIQPWRYTDPLSADNKETSVTTKWKTYISSNLPFYTTVYLSFIERSFQLDLTSNIGTMLLFRVTKVFAQSGLSDFIRSGENRLLSEVMDSPSLSIKSVFELLEGSSFQYQPVFDLLVYEAVLFDNIQQSRAQLSSKIGSPVSNTQFEGENRSWFSSLWHDLFDPPESDTPTQPVDPVKLVSYLDSIENNLRTFFKLPGSNDLGSSLFVSFDGSPSLHTSTVSPSSSHLGQYIDHTHLATPPDSIEAEYEEGSCKLTPKGRDQVRTGLRLCNQSRVMPLCDPLLQPIRSYENKVLVRLLYRLSSHLNDKLSSQLTLIGTSDRFFYKFLLQFLTPPHRPSHRSSLPVPPVPTTPTSKQTLSSTPLLSEGVQEEGEGMHPRINLRVFGSYYTLSYLLLSLLVIWLTSAPLVLIFIIILLSVLAYGTIRYCLSRD